MLLSSCARMNSGLQNSTLLNRNRQKGHFSNEAQVAEALSPGTEAQSNYFCKPFHPHLPLGRSQSVLGEMSQKQVSDFSRICHCSLHSLLDIICSHFLGDAAGLTAFCTFWPSLACTNSSDVLSRNEHMAMLMPSKESLGCASGRRHFWPLEALREDSVAMERACS